MKELSFEWDENKAKSNLAKHGAIRIISVRKATRNEASHYRR